LEHSVFCLRSIKFVSNFGFRASDLVLIARRTLRPLRELAFI
jgi:hypothetical protein